MAKYAVISEDPIFLTDVVMNIVEWDGVTAWAPPEGSTVVAVPPNTKVSIGYGYDGETFTAPPSGGPVNPEGDWEDTKQGVFADIDVRTAELIAKGFVYRGKRFPLTITSQTKLLGMEAVRDEPWFVYPVRFNTTDNTDHIDLADSSEIHAMFTAAGVALRSRLDSGTALKDLVRAAQSALDLSAIVDDRA